MYASRVRTITTLAVSAALCAVAAAQSSQYALRFYGTGVGPPGQQDRVRIAIDDNAPGPDASAACDVGAGSFTVEFWLRGNLADNATTNTGGDADLPGVPWIEGNIVIDRDIWAGGAGGDWGISVAGGFVRFGTGGVGPESTIEGDANVLTGGWRHVACVRDAATGRKHIYVDGVLDFSSTTNLHFDDISYPNNGVAAPATPWNPYIVLAAEKHDAGAAFPSFNGYLDELRVWNTARTPAQIAATYNTLVAPNEPGLVADYRFEEGSGTVIADSSSAGSPAGQLIAGAPGNGEWVSFATNPNNTAPIGGGPVPPGFARTTVVSGLSEPTTLEFAPDGRAFVAQRNGVIRVMQGGALLPTPLISIPADTVNGERGLVGLAIDPSFALNGYVYVYYTTLEPRNRVSRFTVVGNTAALATEFVLWQNLEPAANYHHGGCIRFGPDGNLYIATGDQFDTQSAQDLSRQHGKLLRIRPDGTIPPDNPFIGVPGAAPEVWARGLRNPFRFTFDALTGALWIGNVGGNSADSWEELNRGSAGANYGWPNQEGPQCFISDCAAYTFPVWSYQHNDPAYYEGLFQASITVGPVYRATAFPPQYRGNLYIGDYANRWIRRLVLDAGGSVVADPLFLAAPEAGTIVDLKVGPDGALYYVTIGVPWSGSPDVGAVHRIAYTAGGNAPPVAVAAATPQTGPTPLAVQFSSAGSFDPDSGPQPLSYAWTFGDGGSSNAAAPQHTYVSPGVYSAQLAVSDGQDSVAAAPLQIVAGNAPVVTIAQPPPGTIYRAGQTINFSGGATDVEDGSLPPGALTWTVVLIHANHTHPFFGPLAGVSSGSFQIPTTGHEPENTYYEIRLDAVDSSGLPGSTTRAIQPEIAEIVVDTSPSGIPFFLDGAPEATPRTIESLVGFVHEIEAQPSFTLGGQFYQFQCWQDGAPRVRTITVPAGGLNLVAQYATADNGEITAAVPAANRNADYWPPAGQAYGNFYDALALCCGRDGGGPYQAGMQFALNLPQGTPILSADLSVVATADQNGGPVAMVRGYDVASAPAFAAGSATPLTAWAALTSAQVAWPFPGFSPGQSYVSPDLTAIVQEIVDRPDWQAGSYIGLVLDPGATTADQWRCFRNFASGNPPVLRVTYPADPPPPCITVGDTNCDGTIDFFDIDPFLLALFNPTQYAATYCGGNLGAADIDCNGGVDFFDIDPFLACLFNACPPCP